MIIIDIIIAGLLIYGFVRGLMKGLFVEVASLVALIGGIYGAIHFSYIVADYLKNTLTWKEQYIQLTSFAITFILIVLGVSLLGRVLTKIADFAFLGWLNKLAGGIFGLAKKALILSVIFLFIEKFDSVYQIIGEETKEKSILYRPVRDLLPRLFPEFTDKILKGENPLKEKEDKEEKEKEGKSVI